jgi:SAM-dependent methyltransferase
MKVVDLREQHRGQFGTPQEQLGAIRGTHPSPAGVQSIATLLAPLEIAPGDVVADIGFGSGYTIPWLSRTVGPSGSVYAVEVSERALQYLEQRLSVIQPGNVILHQSKKDDLALPVHTLDRSFLINVVHVFSWSEKQGLLENGQRFVESIYRATRPGGRVLVVDQDGRRMNKTNTRDKAAGGMVGTDTAENANEYAFHQGADGARTAHLRDPGAAKKEGWQEQTMALPPQVVRYSFERAGFVSVAQVESRESIYQLVFERPIE